MRAKKQESVEQYLQRGGQVTVCKPYVPRHNIHRLETYEAKLTAAVKLVQAGNLSAALVLLR